MRWHLSTNIAMSPVSDEEEWCLAFDEPGSRSRCWASYSLVFFKHVCPWIGFEICCAAPDQSWGTWGEEVGSVARQPQRRATFHLPILGLQLPRCPSVKPDASRPFKAVQGTGKADSGRADDWLWLLKHASLQILERDCGGPGGGVGCAEVPWIFVLQDRCLWPWGTGEPHVPTPSASHFPAQCSARPPVLGQACGEAHSVRSRNRRAQQAQHRRESLRQGAADPRLQGLVPPGGCRKIFGQPQFCFRKCGLTAKLVQWRAPWYLDPSTEANGQNASNLPVQGFGAGLIG